MTVKFFLRSSGIDPNVLYEYVMSKKPDTIFLAANIQHEIVTRYKLALNSESRVHHKVMMIEQSYRDLRGRLIRSGYDILPESINSTIIIKN